MPDLSTLNLSGYMSKPVPNTFMKQDGETDKLAIIYPGMGYKCSMPLLYYTTQVLFAKGYDVLWVEYDYNKDSPVYMLPEAKQLDSIAIDANAAYSLAFTQRKYKKVMLVGKSLGNIA